MIGELPGKPQAELDALLEQAAEEEEPAATLDGDALKKLIDPGGGPAPLVRRGVSIAADMKMGWRPRVPVAGVSGAPIPLFYDYE